jgi:NAD(P)H-flavin reductase
LSLPVPAAARSRRIVTARNDVGGGLWSIAFSGGDDTKTHRVPGQYTWVEAEGVGGYFVLANRPGNETWEVIVRAGGGAADVLMRMNTGDEIAATAALGRGFPCEETIDRELVIAVPCSAIAVARPVVLWRIDRKVAKKTTLLLGAKDKSEVPLSGELDAFRAEGVDVTVCLSRESPNGTVGFAHGYVQDVALDKVGDRSPVFFVAGGTKAESGVRATFGPREGEIHSNY